MFEAETTSDHDIDFGHYWAMCPASPKQKCSGDNHVVCPLPLRDRDGYLGGYFLVPGEISKKMSNDLASGTWSPDYEFVMTSRGKSIQQKGRGEGNPDLLINSEAITLEKMHFPDRPNIDTWSDQCGFDQQRYDAKKPWCMYNIMLVEWKDGVAYRLGVGKMHIDSWAQASPKKKIIELG